jgi:hypothetical protein
VKSEDYVELQFRFKEDQDWVDDLMEIIGRFERDNKGFEATALRSLREQYIKKVKAAQDELTCEQPDLR